MSENVTVAAIAAMGNQRQIGKDKQLLWDISEDLKRFKQLTTGKAVIMGRKTWESLPKSFRPLPNRENIVLTRNEAYEAVGATVKNNLNDALEHAKSWSKDQGQDEVFIIGGGGIYKQALPETNRLYLTFFDSDKSGDTFFPAYEDEFEIIEQEKNNTGELAYTFATLERT